MERLTDEQREELDAAALQRYLLSLTSEGASIANQMVAAVTAKAESDKAVAVLKAQSGWIKQEISATQSVLKSMR